MTPDVEGLIRFYKSPLGWLTRHYIREQVSALAGDVTGLRILGLGFATPYLRGALKGAERVLAFMPARQGASAWPREGPSHTVLCDPLELPLTDAAVDLVIMVHGLEHVPDAEEMMRELWRVCAPNARLVIAVPGGGGSGPYRQHPARVGYPYSRGQMDQLLRAHSFTPRRGAIASSFPGEIGPDTAFGPAHRADGAPVRPYAVVGDVRQGEKGTVSRRRPAQEGRKDAGRTGARPADGAAEALRRGQGHCGNTRRKTGFHVLRNCSMVRRGFPLRFSIKETMN